MLLAVVYTVSLEGSCCTQYRTREDCGRNETPVGSSCHMVRNSTLFSGLRDWRKGNGDKQKTPVSPALSQLAECRLVKRHTGRDGSGRTTSSLPDEHMQLG